MSVVFLHPPDPLPQLQISSTLVLRTRRGRDLWSFRPLAAPLSPTPDYRAPAPFRAPLCCGAAAARGRAFDKCAPKTTVRSPSENRRHSCNYRAMNGEIFWFRSRHRFVGVVIKSAKAARPDPDKYDPCSFSGGRRPMGRGDKPRANSGPGPGERRKGFFRQIGHEVKFIEQTVVVFAEICL